jgi:hypothetical protein
MSTQWRGAAKAQGLHYQPWLMLSNDGRAANHVGIHAAAGHRFSVNSAPS